MGLFDWLRPTRSTVEVLDDVLWLSKTAKLSGIAASIEKDDAGPARPAVTLLVAHFPDCLTELHELAKVRKFDPLRVIPLRANRLQEFGSSITTIDQGNRIDIVVGERHPLRCHDDAVLEVAGRFACRCRLVHHLSLEDPLMHAFAGDWVQNLLKRLGMAENEAIQSQMLARSIKQAQGKVARKAVGDMDAPSAEEWLSLNCPT